MEKFQNMGMQTFDTALYHLNINGKISLEEALKNADAENNLRLRIEPGEKSKTGSVDSDDAFGGLSLVEEPEEEEDDEANENELGEPLINS